jgi:3-deoxy-manno-octulosonate cytidylyltransferase (CMP-KDO synthetase)
MTIAIVIPARFASTRLPEKMMLKETGWTLIRHTYEQVKKSKLADRVVIATDDARIEAEAKSFGAEVVMTDPNHPTGTDRLAEVASKYLPDVDFIVNVQGDEPELESENIDRLIELFKAGREKAVMGTLVTPFPKDKTEGAGSPVDPNCCKALLGLSVNDNKGKELGYEALYFSRSLVPYPRDAAGKVEDPTKHYLHLGIYAYTPEFLKRYVAMPQGKLEMTEKLEQLRILENGLKIIAGIVPQSNPGVDTRADYDAFVARHKSNQGK